MSIALLRSKGCGSEVLGYYRIIIYFDADYYLLTDSG